MPMIRIVLLLVVLGGLTLLLAQNWSPVLPLVFLGIKTQALPLALWILIGVGAGAGTSLFITGLFKLSNYFTRSKPRYRRNTVEDSKTQPRGAQHTAASQSQPDTNVSTPSDAAADDWESDSTDDDDWDFDEDADKTRNSSSQKDVSTSYEVSSEPKSSSRSGSYSYSYREPKRSGVGKTESVYDADYRVLTPPHKETDPALKDEDWGFEDEDDK